MFRISTITRVGLVAVACAAVAAPSGLAKTPVEGNAKSLYGYAMSYTPTKATPKKAPKSLYGYAMSYTPTKATPKKAPKSLYGYAMSYTPTKAIRTLAKPVAQTSAAGVDPYLTDVNVRPGESLGGPDGGPAVPRPALESKGTSAKADTQADIERMRRIWTDRD